MSKIHSGDICKVASNVVFAFIEGQEMHSTITIQNLVDRIVSYKIKTNKPGIYLVKPMDGQIFNRSTVTISFKRKELTLENFNMIQNNPGQASCEIEDAVGIQQKCQQLAYLGVAFTKPTNQQKSQIEAKANWNDEGKVRKDKFVQKGNDLDKVIEFKSEELRKLIVERQTLQAKNAGPSERKTFTNVDLINVLAVALLLGFVIL